MFPIFKIGMNYSQSIITDKIKNKHPLGHIQTKPIDGKVPLKGRLVVQQHDADRAGSHWDIRVVIPNQGRSISFVYGSSKEKIKNGEQFSIGRGRISKIIRQPDHSAKYADFEGTIDEGYGKGSVRKVYDKDILITKLNNDEIQFIVEGQKVTMFQMDEDWGMNSSGATTSKFKPLPKGKYAIPKEYDKYIQSGEYIAQEKIDGGNYTMIIDEYGNGHIVSHREGKDGWIDQQYKIRDKSIYGDLPAGTVLQGEIWHKDGPYRTAGILNSHPLKAHNEQRKHGNLQFTAWDIKSLAGNDVSDLPHEERYELLKSMSDDYHINVVKQYNIKNEKQLDKALNHSLKHHGEGLVLKHKTDNSKPWIKVKPVTIMNCEIVTVNEGDGRCKDSMGSITCKTENNGIVNVGTGYDDKTRKWFWDHRSELEGQIVEVEFLDETEGSLRSPVFHRLSPTQSSILPELEEMKCGK